MGKTGKYVLYGAGALVAVALLSKYTGMYDVYAKFGSHPDDASPSTRNPWRGSGKPCEATFDALTLPQKQQAVIAYADAKQGSGPATVALKALQLTC